MGKRNWQWTSIRERLIDQGWTIENKDGRHVRCIPPDSTKPMVFCSTTEHHSRSTRNAIQQLKQSGFDPDRNVPPSPSSCPSSSGVPDDPEPAPAPVPNQEPASGPKLAPFGPALHQARISHGLKITEVADLVGASAGSVGYWEKGQRAPYNEELYGKLCELFPELCQAQAPDFRRKFSDRPGTKRDSAPTCGPASAVPGPSGKDAMANDSTDLVAAVVRLASGLHGGTYSVTFNQGKDEWEAVLRSCQDDRSRSSTAGTPTLALRGILVELRSEAEERRSELERLMAAADI